MKHILTITTLAISIVVGTANARDVDPSKYSTSLRTFITDVVYEVEAGDRDKKFKKLAPHLQIKMHGDKNGEVIFNTKLKQFLAATGVTTEKPQGESGITCDLQVYFGSTADIKAKAADIDKEISFKDGATYWKWWDGTHTVNRVVIFVSTDEFKGEALEDRIVELLLAVFGLPSQSKRADNSCLSTDDKIKPSLQHLDIAVLNFLYQSVPAGTSPTELKNLIRGKWPKR